MNPTQSNTFASPIHDNGSRWALGVHGGWVSGSGIASVKPHATLDPDDPFPALSDRRMIVHGHVDIGGAIPVAG